MTLYHPEYEYDGLVPVYRPATAVAADPTFCAEPIHLPVTEGFRLAQERTRFVVGMMTYGVVAFVAVLATLAALYGVYRQVNLIDHRLAMEARV